jgi:hypothetical protein
MSYKNKHLVSSSLPGSDLQVGCVLVVRRETGGDDGPKVGRLELVGLGEGRHGCLQEVTLGSGRSLGLGYISVRALKVRKGTYCNNPGYQPSATSFWKRGRQRYRYLGLYISIRPLLQDPPSGGDLTYEQG